MYGVTMSECTARLAPSAPNPRRPTSSSTTQENSKGAPMPPYSAGASTPRRPAFAQPAAGDLEGRAGAAVLGGRIHAQQASFAELVPQLARRDPFLLPFV